MEYLENIKLTSLQGVMGIVTFLMFFGAIAFLISHIKKRHKLYNKIADKTKTDEAGNEKRISFNDALNITKSRLRNEFVASVNHDMLMFGTILFTLCLMFIIIQLIVKVLFGAVFFKGIFYNVHSVIFNISITLIFLGSLIAILRRASGLNPRLERSREHFMPLVSLLIVPIIASIGEGIKASTYNVNSYVAFTGLPVKNLIGNTISNETLSNLYSVFLLLLVAALAFALIYAMNTKLYHMVAAFENLGKQKEVNYGRIKNDEVLINNYFKTDTDIEEDEAVFGIKYIDDLKSGQLIHLDSCAECGRCDSVCPAHLSGKSMSPHKMIKILKEHVENFKEPKETQMDDSQELKKMIWDCNMCHACDEACPSLIEHVDKVVGLRRNFVLNSGDTEPEWKKVINNVEKYNNPFGFDNSKRMELIKELDIPLLKKDEKVDYVLWIGCHGYFDPRMKNIVKKLLELLRTAGKSFAVLSEEVCCGDTIRRVGGEFQFQEILYKNKEIFDSYHIDKLLTICPHCYNTMKKEYPTFGVKVNAVHYVEILNEIVSSNDEHLKDEKKKVFYHDSCYLGRINSLYEQPRQAIKNQSDKYELVSIKQEKENSLCCGGGAGRIWIDEKVENRPSMIKLEQLKGKNVDVIVTSCPYCLNMYSDAVQAEQASMEVKDLLEIL